MTYEELQEFLKKLSYIHPPIIVAAIKAILDLEERIDDMGYDISYYQEDLPKVVADAIKPWANY